MFKFKKGILICLSFATISCSSQPEYSVVQESLFEKAYRLDEQGDYTEALEIYKEVANQGISESGAALHNMGILYYRGRGVVQDINKGIYLLGQSALRGYALAYTNLGYIYTSGHYGVPKNCELAVPYLLEGARKGSVGAHNYIQNNFGLSRSNYMVSIANVDAMARILGADTRDVLQQTLSSLKNVEVNMIQQCKRINFNIL